MYDLDIIFQYLIKLALSVEFYQKSYINSNHLRFSSASSIANEYSSLSRLKFFSYSDGVVSFIEVPPAYTPGVGKKPFGFQLII